LGAGSTEAAGIAVFNDEYNSDYRLKHYFDISDTHGSRYERPVPLWDMKPEYVAGVMETVRNAFGAMEDAPDLPSMLFSAARNLVDDNISDYLSDLLDCRQDSALEDLDAFNVEAEYRRALTHSVAYMLLTRCGMDADQYLGLEDFRFVTDFNTRHTVNALGVAAGDIAETALREIADTVLSLQRQYENQNRTFAKPKIPAHNETNRSTNGERSVEHDRTDLPDGERLSDPRSGRTGGRPGDPWQIRVAPKGTPPTAPPRPVPEPADGGDAERAPDGDRADGTGTAGTGDPADGGAGRRDGSTESGGSNEVGGTDEPHPALGGGSDPERPDLRVKPLPTERRQLSLFEEAAEPAKARTPAFSVSQQIIDEVLTSGGNEGNSTLRIAAYFKKDHMTAANADFLRREYGMGGKGFIFGGHHVSVWFDSNGLRVAEGDTAESPGAARVTWEQAARRIRELLDLGRYMPRSELDKVDGNELMEWAEQLWNLHHDLAGGAVFFIDEALFRQGAPESMARIAELLAQPEERETILAGLRTLAADYESNHGLLRFPGSVRYLRAALAGLEDLQREPLTFTADESVSTPRPGFITQDEVDRVLTGNGVPGNVRKLNIYAYFLRNHTAKEKADFLKNQYGTGGSSRTGFNEWHDAKGIAYSRENNHMPYDKVMLSWPKAARRIDELIADGRYMTGRELEYIPEYEKSTLAGEIYSFYPYRPEDLPRPFPHGTEYAEGMEIIRGQMDDPARVAEILAQMAAILDNTADIDRNYGFMRKAFDDLTAYQNGRYSLFASAVKPTENTVQRQPRSAKPASPESAPTPVGPNQFEPTQLELTQPEIALAKPESSALSDTGVEYDLRLGVTVYLGTEAYEIYAYDANSVVLRDPKAPLFTREMPRTEFDRKLRENRLNNGLIRPTVASEASEIQPVAAPAATETNEITPPVPESEAEPPYIPQTGDIYEIQGRRFAVDSVDTDFDKVSLRDITFQNSAGFPIFRSESLDFIRMYDPIRPEPESALERP
jgi:hypothetical protein